MRALDLCAGAGGLSLGLADAGLEVFGVEGDPEDMEFSAEAVETHRAGAGPCELVSLADYRGGDRFDVVAGGIPCQPFSVAGWRAGTSTPKGRAYVDAARIARESGARVVLLENVAGLLTWCDGDGVLVLERIRRELAEQGFPHLRHRVLNAWRYGVPQSRERLFMVAFAAASDAARFAWPPSTHEAPPVGFLGLQPWETVRQALRLGPGRFAVGKVEGARGWQGQRIIDVDAPSPAVGASDNAEFVARASELSSWLDRPAPTITTTARHPGRDKARPTRRPLGEMARAVCAAGEDEFAAELERAGLLDRPGTTVQGDVRIAPAGHHDRQQSGAVRLTVEQLAILQDFPRGYVFHGATIASRARQVGNAVPRRLGAAVGRQAVFALGGVP